MNITEFLNARIAEDEAGAINAAASINRAKNGNGNARAGTHWTANTGMVEGQHTGDWGDSDLWDCEGARSLCVAEEVADHMARYDPHRVLVECKSKRAIVEIADGMFWGDYGENGTARAILYPIAAVYDDHPEYDKAWAIH